jgi:hypothetical protein
MKGSQKWLLIALFFFILGFFTDLYGFLTFLFWLSMLGLAYCLGKDAVLNELNNAKAVLHTESLKCDNCGDSPHLTELAGYWLCDACYKQALDPHCPICKVLIEPDSEEARVKHMTEIHGRHQEDSNRATTEGAA